MGQQEEDHEATGPGNGVQDPESHSLAGCLEELRDALDLHKLVFLCGHAIGFGSVVEPRKPPRIMGSGVTLPDITKEDLAGAGEELILQLKPTLERHAHQVLHELGNRKERRYWDISPTTAYYLEGTSDRILATCTQVSAKDERGAYTDLVDSAMGVIHDKDQPIWNASKNVRWEYLEELDAVIKAVKIATVRARRAGAGPGAGKETSAVRGPEEGLSLWPDHKDACFKIEGQRIKFHFDGDTKDLRLRNGSQGHSLLTYLTSGSVPGPDIRDLSKGGACKPAEIVKNVNNGLSLKIYNLGFQGVPRRVRFIRYDREKDCYVSLLPIHVQDPSRTTS